MRISIVYRARCFASKEEVFKFNNLPESEEMKLEDIFTKLKNEVRYDVFLSSPFYAIIHSSSFLRP